MEKISIIVPVYNGEKTLERCVKSLTGQSYPNIEILLVNDGSRDGSLSLCRSLAQEDGRIRVLDQPNGGVSSARNAGLTAATGDYVMFCDCDDWVNPQWCQIMLENHRPQSLTVCQYERWEAGDVAQEEIPTVTVDVVPRSEYFHHPVVMCSPCNKIFELGTICRNNLSFTCDLHLGEDFSFVLDYLCSISGEARFLNARLYYYDISTENSLSKRPPSLEQTEHLFFRITSAMDTLGAADAQSQKNRDWLIAPHFENLLRAMALREDVSIGEKYALAKRMEQSAACQACRFDSITWRNSFYMWFLRRRYFRLAMVLLLIRQNRRKCCEVE